MIDAATLRISADLVTLVSRRVKLTRRGKDWYGKCPFHTERSASFAVIPNQRRFYCHGCGASGDAFDWLMRIDGVSFTEAARLLGGGSVDRETRRRLKAEERERERQKRNDERRARLISEYRDRNPACVAPDWLIAV